MTRCAEKSNTVRASSDNKVSISVYMYWRRWISEKKRVFFLIL